MSHPECRDWDYERHPEKTLVLNRSAKLLVALRSSTEKFDRFNYSTLVGHKYLFRATTPGNCRYFAGNYRGSNFPCLKEYEVGVGADKRVGYPALLVSTYMKRFEAQVSDLTVKLREAAKSPDKYPPAVILGKLVIFLADQLVFFLSIHPYANGNGHMGRLFIWVMLGRFGFWPKSWPLHESPGYHNFISQHRDGNKKPLEHFILKCITS